MLTNRNILMKKIDDRPLFGLRIKPGIQEQGTECGERGMGECYIPGNVAKHSGECRRTFHGMSPMFGVKEENYWAESHLQSC